MPLQNRIPVLLVLLLAGVGCGTSSSDDEVANRCNRALAKVALEELYSAPGATGAPSAGEKAIMEGVRKGSQAQCEAEGLSKEQAACFENIKDIETLFAAADCPAIAANKPSWFRVPPAEMRREALEKMRAKGAAESN